MRVSDYVRDRLALIEAREYLAWDRLQPGAIQALQELRTHRLRLVTLRKNRANLLWQLSNLGLAGFFAGVHSRDENDGTWQAKRELVVETGIMPGQDALIVGDTEADVLTARDLGCFSIAVESGIRTRKLLEALKPDAIIAHVGELQRAMDGLVARRTR